MSSNESTARTELAHSLIYAATLAEVVVAVVGNALVVGAVLLCKTLRNKEVTPLLILAIADALLCLARGYVMSLGEYRPQLAVRLSWRAYTPRQCFGAATVAHFGVTQAQGAAMLLLSIDRFVALAFFDAYVQLGRRYTYAITATVVGYSGFISAVAVIANRYLMADEATRALNCLAVAKFPVWFEAARWTALLMYGFGSVVVYAAVIVVNRRKKLSAAKGLRKVQLQRQKRLARTLSLVATATAVSFWLPYSAIVAAKLLTPTLSRAQFIVPLQFATMANSSVNAVIYFCRLPDMREAMISLMRCKNPNVTQAMAVAVPMKRQGNWCDQSDITTPNAY